VRQWHRSFRVTRRVFNLSRRRFSLVRTREFQVAVNAKTPIGSWQMDTVKKRGRRRFINKQTRATTVETRIDARRGCGATWRTAAKWLLRFRANDKKLSVMTRDQPAPERAALSRESRANTGAFTRRVISIRGRKARASETARSIKPGGRFDRIFLARERRTNGRRSLRKSLHFLVARIITPSTANNKINHGLVKASVMPRRGGASARAKRTAAFAALRL